MPGINEVDLEVLEALSGGDKLKALLKARGLTLKDFGRKYNHWVADVSRCLSGERPLSEIRDDVGAELGIPRQQIDRLIDGEPEAAAKAG